MMKTMWECMRNFSLFMFALYFKVNIHLWSDFLLHYSSISFYSPMRGPAFSRVPAGVYWSDNSFRFIISSLYKCAQMLLRTWAPNLADHKLAFKMYIKGTDKCFSAVPNDLWGQGERNCMNLFNVSKLYAEICMRSVPFYVKQIR